MVRWVRLGTPDDAAACAAIYQPYVTDTSISFETTPPDAAEMQRRIETSLRTHTWLVLEDAGNVVGYAYGSQHRTRDAYRWSCDVAVYLRRASAGSGGGRLLYDVLLPALAGLGYQMAFAGVTQPNPASEGLHRACGFEEVGLYRRVGYKFGQWLDVRWFQRPIGEFPADPAEPSSGSETTHTTVAGSGNRLGP